MINCHPVRNDALIAMDEATRVGRLVVIDEGIGATVEEVSRTFNAFPEVVKALAQLPFIAEENPHNSR